MWYAAFVDASCETFKALREYDRWSTLARIDTSLRYRRTVLGPWWVTLSTGIMVASVGALYGGIFGSPLVEYMPFFAIGIIIWTFVSATLTESCAIFPQLQAMVKSAPTPLIWHLLRMTARQAIVLAHNTVLVVLLWILFRWPIGFEVLLVIPGLALVAVAVFGTVLLFSILCARFRDVQQIMTALLQLLFLFTPIIWMPGSVRGKAASYLLDLNPLYHLIEVVRAPLLGQWPSAVTWATATGCSVFLLVAGLLLYGRFRHRVAYWL